MSIHVSQSLATFFQEEVDEALRLVGHYTDDSFDLVYLRDDLKAEYDESDFRQTFQIHRQDKAAAAKQGEIINAGAQHCTLRVYDNAIVFNFAQTDEIGTIVSVNPRVGQNLLSFITRSLEQLHTDSPQQVTPPNWLSE